MFYAIFHRIVAYAAFVNLPKLLLWIIKKIISKVYRNIMLCKCQGYNLQLTLIIKCTIAHVNKFHNLQVASSSKVFLAPSLFQWSILLATILLPVLKPAYLLTFCQSKNLPAHRPCCQSVLLPTFLTSRSQACLSP